MRRALGVLLAVAVAAGGALAAGAGGGGGSDYRVDALFDNAANLIPGQDVKVAGAKVGKVVGVRVTPARKARVEMQVDGRFAPFHSDAQCEIRPQSLIGEKYIDCSPGTPRGRALRGTDGHAPTVPLSRTHSPVDLDLVFGALRLPYRERLTLIINELGVGLAGRAPDLNAAIRRANPALQESDRVLRILDRDRARLGALVDDSDAIIAQLARRRGDVARFVDRASEVATRTAEHRTALAGAVRRLPAALAQARPTLDRARELIDVGTPVAADLAAAAPGVNRLIGDLGPLADAARPALVRLGIAAAQGIRAVRPARPVVARLRAFAAAVRPTGSLLEALLASLRQRGVVEGLQTFTYFAASATSRFDRFSHTLPAHLIGTECQQWATTPLPECDAHFAGTPAGASSGRAAPGRASHAGRRGGRRARAVAPVAGGSPSAPRPGTAPAAPPAQQPGGSLEQSVQGILDFLLR